MFGKVLLSFVAKIFVFLFVASCFLLTYQPAQAANPNFSTSAHVTYTVNSSGITHVFFSVTLTNTTDKYYATQYKIHLGFQDIQNVQAYDSGGAIIPSVDKTSVGEDLTVPFNDQTAGKGRQVPFSFSFDTKEVASLNGSIWEVNIPGLSSADDFSDFTVHINTPPYFGKPTYVKPNVGDGSLTFTKDQLGKSGISLAFGDKQVYAFRLTYNLQNAQLFPVSTEIALPPNTSYQNVELDSISPKPTNVIMDTDGNWLAQYTLKPSQTLRVNAAGKAFLSLTPSKEPLTPSQAALYTKPTQYWQANDTKIQSLAKSLKSPEAIYAYVVHTLHYNFARISDSQERLGAVAVLAHPDQAVCLEFTDLFIALMRAAGYPARELDGYGYTQNTAQRPLSLQKEILHAWPEYYDASQGAWVMVDPTWENTTGGVDYFHTFDFDHMTLVIKGVSSTYPVPAGGYKLPGHEAEQDVVVSFAPESVAPQPVASAALLSPSVFMAGFPIQTTLQVTNTGNVLLPTQTVLATFMGKNSQYFTPAIPPFGSSALAVTFNKTGFLTNKTDTITIHFAGETIAKQVHITAFSLPVLIGLGGFIVAVLSLIIFIVARRARRVSIPQ